MCRRNVCAGVPSVQSAKYSVAALSRVTPTVPSLLRNLLRSCSTGFTVFLVVASWTTRGDCVRGARLRAEMEDINGAAASAVRNRFFILRFLL